MVRLINDLLDILGLLGMIARVWSCNTFFLTKLKYVFLGRFPLVVYQREG
jgi:hypothetical protein